MIALLIYTAPGGTLLADYSGRAEATFSTNERGFAECAASVAMSLVEAFWLYDQGGTPHVVVADSSSGVTFEGRVEDSAITSTGIELTALGYQRALDDDRYTALWSKTTYKDWRPETVAGVMNERYSFDMATELRINLKKNATYGSTGTSKYAHVAFIIPSLSTRAIVGMSFDYHMEAPAANWLMDCQRRDVALAYLSSPFTRTSTAAGSFTGSRFLPFAGCAAVSFVYGLNAADAVYALEDGQCYLRIYNLRLVTATTNMVNTTNTAPFLAGAGVTITVGTTVNMYVGQRLYIAASGAAVGISVLVEQVLNATQFVCSPTAAGAVGLPVQGFVVYADEIVKDVVAQVSALNPTQLGSSTVRIQSPGVDRVEEIYEDRAPSEILTYLAGEGDGPGRMWEWSVLEDRVLRFQPRGTDAHTWDVDIADLTIEQSLDNLNNRIYANYQDTASRTRRTADTSDADSIVRYGLTRRRELAVSSTDTAIIAVIQAAALTDGAAPQPRSGIVISAPLLSSREAGILPISYVRAGDTLVIRNLPPTLSVNIDRIRSFRLSRVEYDAAANAITVEPETPLPTLVAVLAQLNAGM